MDLYLGCFLVNKTSSNDAKTRTLKATPNENSGTGTGEGVGELEEPDEGAGVGVVCVVACGEVVSLRVSKVTLHIVP